MVDRRTLLAGTARVGVGAAIVAMAGCAGLNSTTLTSDAQLIATGLSGILTDLQAIPNLVIPADVVSKVQNELNIINSNASQIGSLVGGAPAQAISTAVGVVAAALAPFFPMAPMVAVAVQAAVVLAQTLINSAPAASAAAGKMDVAQARAILKAVATK